MEPHNRRLHLRVAAKLMLAVAFFIILYVVLSVMLHSDPDSRVIPSKIVDISGIGAGESRTVLWEGRPILIYRRTTVQARALAFHDERLVDAESDKSKQPAWAKNALRSRTPEYFVSIGVGTDFSCPVRLLLASHEVFMGHVWSGGFVDECRGARYDYAGRVYDNQYADENLIIPEYRIQDQKLILGG